MAKLVWLRNYTSVAVKEIKEPLDFVYVDARHDYCGVTEDISLYWPLIRPGGIMAGHDYENGPDVMRKSGQDWAVCMNGTRVETAVLGAVNDFFEKEGLQVVVAYREKDWNSWMVRKPLSTTVRAAGDHGSFSKCQKPMFTRSTTSKDVGSGSGSSSILDSAKVAELLSKLPAYLQSHEGVLGLGSSSAGQGGSSQSYEKLWGTANVLLVGSIVWALTGVMIMAALFCSCVKPRMVELPGGWVLTSKAGAGRMQKLAKEDA